MLCPDCDKHMNLKQKAQRIDYTEDKVKDSQYFICGKCNLLMYIRREYRLWEAIAGGKEE